MERIGWAVSVACVLWLASLFVDVDTPWHRWALERMAPAFGARHMVKLDHVDHMALLPAHGLWLVVDGETMAQVRARCYLPLLSCYGIVAAKGPGAPAW